jgi:hypothetical protein
MAEPDRPRSPFAASTDFSARPPLRGLAHEEIEQILAAHRLYPDTERREGRRANFASANLSGMGFSSLRRVVRGPRSSRPARRRDLAR